MGKWTPIHDHNDQPFDASTTITVENYGMIQSFTIISASGALVETRTGLNTTEISIGEGIASGLYTVIITTEKDAMRLDKPGLIEVLNKLPMYYIPIEITFDEKEKEEFDKLINEYVFRTNQKHSGVH